jgi:putative transposase
MSRAERLSLIDRQHPKLAIAQQCRLLNVARSTVYYRPAPASVADLELMRLIDEPYLRTPYYGTRRMVEWFRRQGRIVNRKRVQRLMQLMGIEAIYPKPNTSKKHPENKIYPYLLRGLKVDRVNQVWCTDITYIPMAKGFLYLVVIMDWVSRCVLSWRLSNTMDADFCIEALEEALARYGRPEIFNSDQGSQFTSTEFTGVLLRHGVAISMDGRGRFLDNIFIERLWRSLKYEAATSGGPRVPSSQPWPHLGTRFGCAGRGKGQLPPLNWCRSSFFEGFLSLLIAFRVPGAGFLSR